MALAEDVKIAGASQPDPRKSPARVAIVQFDPQVGLENLASNAAAVDRRLRPGRRCRRHPYRAA